MKKIIQIFIFILTITALCSSCKSDNTSASVSKSESIEKVSFDYKYFITIADIDGIESPIRNGTTQVSIPKNTVVKWLNQSSEFRDTQSVNNRKYIEPYEKVKVLKNEIETWVFGAALQPIYAGVGDIEKPQNIEEFVNYISTLDTDNLSSGNQMLMKLQSLITDDPITNDALFFVSNNFINTLARSSAAHASLIKDFDWTLDDYNEIVSNTIDPAYHPIAKILHENGLMLDGALGNIIAASDVQILDDLFEKKLTAPTQEYIDLLLLSKKSKIFDNDNIVSPLTSVLNQANLWSQFEVKYPDFAQISTVKMKSDRLTNALLYGTKNTSAFDYASRMAKPDFKTIWEYAITHYKDTPIGKKVNEHMNWLERNDWKFPEKEHAH